MLESIVSNSMAGNWSQGGFEGLGLVNNPDTLDPLALNNFSHERTDFATQLSGGAPKSGGCQWGVEEIPSAPTTATSSSSSSTRSESESSLGCEVSPPAVQDAPYPEPDNSPQADDAILRMFLNDDVLETEEGQQGMNLNTSRAPGHWNGEGMAASCPVRPQQAVGHFLPQRIHEGVHMEAQAGADGRGLSFVTDNALDISLTVPDVDQRRNRDPLRAASRASSEAIAMHRHLASGSLAFAHNGTTSVSNTIASLPFEKPHLHANNLEVPRLTAWRGATRRSGTSKESVPKVNHSLGLGHPQFDNAVGGDSSKFMGPMAQPAPNAATTYGGTGAGATPQANATTFRSVPFWQGALAPVHYPPIPAGLYSPPEMQVSLPTGSGSAGYAHMPVSQANRHDDPVPSPAFANRWSSSHRVPFSTFRNGSRVQPSMQTVGPTTQMMEASRTAFTYHRPTH